MTNPTLRWGSRGPDVEHLQAKLNDHAADLVEDGSFGNLTLAAVRQFQIDGGLLADGIVGRLTWAKLDAGGAPISPEIHVVAQHGLLGGRKTLGYSLGLDAAIARAVKDGLRVTSTILEYYDDDSAYQASLAAFRRGGSLILMGHSLGAADAPALSNRLVSQGFKPSLVFVFDPTWNDPAPPVRGAMRVVNYYGTQVTSPLGHDRLEPAPDFTGKLFNIGIDVGHTLVDDYLPAQDKFLAEVRYIAGKAPAPPAYP